MRHLREAFATPGVARLMTLSMLARLPQGMASLAVLLHVSAVTGSTGVGGSAAGAWALGACVGQPSWARLARHVSSRRVLLGTSLAQAVLVAVLTTAEPATALVLLAAAGGLAAPPISSVARGLWPDLVPERDRLQRLYGVDATVQELIFIVGPALVAVAVAAASPVAALWLVVAVGLAGNATLASSPLLARTTGGGAVAAGTALWRPMRRIFALSVLLAAALGATEVAVPAVAIEADRPELAGVLLALWSVGSLGGGLAAASLPRQLPPLRQLRVCASACALSTAILAAAAASGVLATGIVVLVAGATIAPALAALYSLVEREVDPGRRTEAFALLVSAFLAGIAAGSAAAGWLSEHASPAVALLAAAPLPLLAVVVARVMRSAGAAGPQA